MEITKEMLRSLREDVNEALAPVAKKYGITLTMGRTSYLDQSFTSKLEGQVLGGQSRAEVEYETYQSLYGLPNLNESIMIEGEEFITTGFKNRAKKNKVMVKRLRDNKGFVCSTDVVVAGRDRHLRQIGAL